MADAEVLRDIEQFLAHGPPTEWTQRAYSAEEVSGVVQALALLPVDDLAGRLITAGFTLAPYVDPGDVDGIEQSCATCMYFERHRGLCDLPELMLPVKAEWSCILWRI